MRNNFPSVGSWYKDAQLGAIFEVVAVDEANQTIETQLIDGEVSEYDMDSWHELELDRIEEPEDWRNAYELSQEDYLNPDDIIVPEDWSNPVNSIESDIINGVFDDL
jgi:hypothetical protein